MKSGRTIEDVAREFEEDFAEDSMEAQGSASTPTGKVPQDSSLTVAEIEAIETYCAAAMDGPWEADIGDRSSDGSDCWVVDAIDQGSVVEMITPADIEEPNARFIAQARADLPRVCAELKRLITSPPVETCTWTLQSDEFGDIWDTSCGSDPWQFETGGPVENKMRFCHHCGRTLVVAERDAEQG